MKPIALNPALRGKMEKSGIIREINIYKTKKQWWSGTLGKCLRFPVQVRVADVI